MDVYTLLAAVSIISVEILLLVYLYRNYITTWNAEKWQEKTKAEGWLEDMLRPVIDVLTDEVTVSVIKQLKGEILAAQGTMTRQITGDIENPEEMMLKVSESLLTSIGYKRPSPIITMKLAQGLGGLAEKVLKNKQSNQGSTDNIKVGQELLNQL